MVYVASERPVRIIIAIIIITNGYLIYDPYINIVPRHVCIIMPLSSFNSPCHGRIIGLLPRPAVSETAQLPVMGQFTIMIYLMGMRNHYSFCCNYNFFVIDQNMLFISWIGCPKMKGPLFFHQPTSENGGPWILRWKIPEPSSTQSLSKCQNSNNPNPVFQGENRNKNQQQITKWLPRPAQFQTTSPGITNLNRPNQGVPGLKPTEIKPSSPKGYVESPKVTVPVPYVPFSLHFKMFNIVQCSFDPKVSSQSVQQFLPTVQRAPASSPPVVGGLSGTGSGLAFFESPGNRDCA